MVKKCYVYSCRSESFAGCNISFHKFPTDAALKKKWLVAIKREQVAKNSVVCSRHFNVDDYLNPYTSKLKPTAVPSVGTPEDGDDSITKICRVCLAIDVKMYEINEFYLELFESVTGIADDELKHEVYQNLCYECVARLSKFNAFKDKALLADSLFQGLLQTGNVIKSKHIKAIQQNYSVFRPNLTIKWIYPPVDYESGEGNTNIKLDHVVDNKIIIPAVEEFKAQFRPVKVDNKAKTDVTNKNIGVKVVNKVNTDLKRTVPNAVVVQNVQTKSIKAKNTVLKRNTTDTKVKVESSRIADENESDFCEYEFLEDEVVGKDSLVNYSERQIKQEYFDDDESITIDEKNIKDEILSDNDRNSNAGDDFNDSNYENDDDIGRTYLTLDNRSSDDDTNCFGDQSSFVVDNINADIIETIKEIVINPIDEENSNNNNSTVIDHDYLQDNATESREQTEREKGKKEIAKKKIVEKSKKVLSRKKFEDDNILIGLEDATDEYRRCVKLQMAILKRLENSEFVVKGFAKNSLDLSLFTVTKRSYQEQLHDIEKRKETQKYKEAPYKCEICFLPFYKARTLDLHTERHTDVWGKLECFICKMRLRNRKGLLQHLTVRHVHYYKCNKCSFGAMTRFAARSHVAYHKSKIYQCKHCNKVFTKPSSYLGHLRLKHLCDFVCELCGYMFLSKHGVSTHKCLKHANEINKKLEGPYCKTCDVTFASQEAHDRHLRLSSRHTVESAPDRLRNEQITRRNFVNLKYTRLRKCQYCSLMFSNRADYNAHIEAKHPEVHAAIEARNKERIKKKCPNTMCEHCGKLFPTKMHLRNHMWVHTGDKYYKCTKCPKSFTSLNALKCHALYKHEGSKANAVCPICGKTLLHASNLQKHMFSHTGQKQHTCTICEKKFTWRHELTSHVKHVHLNVPWPKRVRPRRKEPKTPEEE